MLTRTRLVAAPEPNPFEGLTVWTAAWSYPLVDQLLERIDDVLSSASAADLLGEAQRHRTLLQYEPEPLATLTSIASAGRSAAERARAPAGPADHLDRCLEELQMWLGIGLADLCSAAGISRGTVYAWRKRGSAPRPGTVGGVLRLHGLVSPSVRVAGIDRTREWFHIGDPSPLRRLITANGGHDAMTSVARELRRARTGPVLPPPNPLLAATLDDVPARPLV